MKKILKGFFIFIILILGALFTFPYLFKDKIIAAAKDAANQSLNATLNFEKLDVSILENIKHFPDISLVVYNPTIIGKNQFVGDTLIRLEKIKLALDIKSIFQTENPMQVNAIDIINGRINAKVDTAGLANWDIVKSNDTTKSNSKFSMNLSKLNIENIDVYYHSFKDNQTLDIQNLNHNGNGNFSDNLVNYKSKTDIENISFFNGIVPYIKNAHIVNESDIQIDQTAKKYTLTKNNIQVNELNLILDGSIQQMDKAMNLNLNFLTDNNEFKNILSLIPSIYQNNFKEIKTNGKFDLKGNVNGIYKDNIYPKMDILFNVQNGEFQYPSLPQKISKIEINSSIKSSGGSLDNMVIDVSKFSMMIGKDPFNGKLNLTNPMTNPAIDLSTKGKLNLADILNFYPMKDVKTLQGMMNLDLNLKAKKSDLVAKNYSAITADGIAEIKGLIYESSSVEKPMRISDITLNFTPQYVHVPACYGTIGKTDFNITGKLENFIGYYLSKDDIMTGQMNLTSKLIDVNEFISDKKDSKEEYVLVPAKINFTGNANISEMKYGKMTIQKLVGGLNIVDEKIKLNNINAELLGGTAKINAIYNTKGLSKPTTTMQYDVQSLDMTQVYHYMECAPKIAPIMQYMTGKISSNSNLSMSLLPDMGPDLNTLNGDFNISIPFAKIVNLPLLNQIVQTTKLTQLNNLEAKDIKAKLSFVDGKMVLQPVNFKANNMNIGLSGMQGLDKSIDYKMAVDVPFSQLGNASSVVNGLIQKFKLPFIGNINPESIRLNLNIKGFFDKPQVGMGAPEILTNGKPADAKTVAVDAVKKAGDDIKNQALKTADSLKQKAINEAQKKGEELKKEAENKLNEAKKKAEDELKKKKDELLDKIKLPW